MEIAAIVVGGVLVLLISAMVLRPTRSRGMSPQARAKIQARWADVEAKVSKGGPTNFRQAVVDADSLVDLALRDLGVPGGSMGERLRESKNRFSRLNDVWAAHKVRNEIVHDVDRELLSFETNKVIARFKQALTDLGAL